MTAIRMRRPVDYLSMLVDAARSSLYTNAFYIMLSQAGMALLGFFFWVIVARYYTEAEVGYSSAIISAIGLRNSINPLSIHQRTPFCCWTRIWKSLLLAAWTADSWLHAARTR